MSLSYFLSHFKRPQYIIPVALFGCAAIALYLWQAHFQASKGEVFRTTLIQHHLRLDRAVRQSSVLLFGASTIQGLDASQLRCRAVNFGIGGETAEGLLQRLPRYRSYRNADTIILQTGINNILRRETGSLRVTLQRLIQEFSRHADVLIVPYQTIAASGWNTPRRQQLDNWNDVQRQICGEAPRCRILSIDKLTGADTGNLEPDGIHLNSSGYRFLLRALNEELEHRRCAKAPFE